MPRPRLLSDLPLDKTQPNSARCLGGVIQNNNGTELLTPLAPETKQSTTIVLESAKDSTPVLNKTEDKANVNTTSQEPVSNNNTVHDQQPHVPLEREPQIQQRFADRVIINNDTPRVSEWEIIQEHRRLAAPLETLQDPLRPLRDIQERQERVIREHVQEQRVAEEHAQEAGNILGRLELLGQRTDQLLVTLQGWISSHPFQFTIGIATIGGVLYMGIRFQWLGRIIRVITGTTIPNDFYARTMEQPFTPIPPIPAPMINPNHPFSNIIPEPNLPNSAALVTILAALRSFLRFRR